MKYRKFGKLDWEVSAIGFGCMRLPIVGTGSRGSNVDQAEATRMIRHAVDNGVNYIDTAYPYHGGQSEVVLGKALQDGYREKICLATKSPIWQVNSADDFDKFLEEQLQRLQTSYVDFYLLHALNRSHWRDRVLKHGILERAEAAIRDGRIRYLGFSFHDGFDAFAEILNDYNGFTFCQIQYNYMDTENQAGTKGLKLAAEKGLAVVIMEPLLGGKLANPPASIQEIFQAADTEKTPVDWALQWLWNQPEVSTVLSGMSTIDQVEANLRSGDLAAVGSFEADDLAVVDRVKEAYKKRIPIPCTRCNYCMPCPNSVNIPGNFGALNEAHLHDDFAGGRRAYQRITNSNQHAEKCIACRVCEEHCPQGIAISEWMPKVHDALRPQA